MKYTDLFIRRPILATVISLMILTLGLRAVFSLPVLQYPRTENAVVTVTTTYYGADGDIIAGFITTPLENAIAQANGIDYLTSTSQSGISTIKAYLRMNYDSNKALTEISAKVNSVLNKIPSDAEQPVLEISTGETIASMYLGFSSEVLDGNAITDYLTRVVQPKLQAVEGVQTAEILGAQNFALRVWMDPQKLAAYRMTATDIYRVLAANNYISALGSTKGQMVQVALTASTDLSSLDEFRNLIVKQDNGAIVRLKDVANVTLGADNYDVRVAFDGKDAVYVAIQAAPSANLLKVVAGVRSIFPKLQEQLPEGIKGNIVYDATKFVNSSIEEVKSTLIESVVIVTLVVFAFLGSWRSVIVPTVAIPLSLVGAFIFMMGFGFSINLLTLLALVLGIGMVVDDAIIVVENVNRHMDAGMKPFQASILAARELANPIIAMTLVLIAVYVPIGFQPGLTGSLFSEFAFTLVAAIVVSGIVAVTLSPMLCARILKPHDERHGWEDRLVEYIDHYFSKLASQYETKLRASLNYLPVTVAFSALILVSLFFLYSTSKSELAPEEDQGIVMTFSSSAPNATLEQRLSYTYAMQEVFKTFPEMDHSFQIDAPGQSMAGMVLKPWDERERNAEEIQGELQQKISAIPGVKVAAFQPPALPGSEGLPIQFVITTTQPFERLEEVAADFLQKAKASGQFMFIDKDLKIDQPQVKLNINREKVAQMGLTMSDVGSSLSAMLGGGYVNYFSLSGRSYKVIPQVQQVDRLNADQLNKYFVRTSKGEMVHVSSIAEMTTKAIPQSVNHFQQMNSVTVSGVMFPGVALGDALEYMNKLAKDTLPEGFTVDYAGQSRQFFNEASGFAMMFVLAMLVIFLTLSAQYESFRDPLIILISVPMSIAGALLFINLGWGGASLNIYTQVGLVTLIGLISKHGILMTEFANILQEEGHSKREAIVKASALRLRPILMTAGSTVLGVVPLITASGAGALSRYNMGLVIATGMTIGTIFTLFVVPAIYLMIAADRQKAVLLDREQQKLIDDLDSTKHESL